LNKPHRFSLKLSKGHLDSKVRSIEKYGMWFPPIDVVFELKSDGKVYRTYIDSANRLRLNEILEDNPLARPGDHLIFTPLAGGRYWSVTVERTNSVEQTRLLDEKQHKKRRRTRIKLDHKLLQNMLMDLAIQYGRYPEKEFRLERLQYDVVWKRVKSGNPVKVFEIQVHGSLESALTKLKHAYDTWNADLFLVLTSLKEVERAEYLLSGSFHEIQKRTTMFLGTEVYEMLTHKIRHTVIEKKLEK